MWGIELRRLFEVDDPALQHVTESYISNESMAATTGGAVSNLQIVARKLGYHSTAHTCADASWGCEAFSIMSGTLLSSSHTHSDSTTTTTITPEPVLSCSNLRMLFHCARPLLPSSVHVLLVTLQAGYSANAPHSPSF